MNAALLRRGCLRRHARFSSAAVAGIIMANETPSTIEIDMNELEDALRRAEEKLTRRTTRCSRRWRMPTPTSPSWWTTRTPRIARLRKLLFGAKTEKTAAVVGGKDRSRVGGSSAADGDAGADGSRISIRRGRREMLRSQPRQGPRPQRGRRLHRRREDRGASRSRSQPGDPCPKCDEGTVYETGRPGVLVRLVGQPPCGAKIYDLQKLRCNLCGEVFTAESPEGVGDGEVRRDGRAA